jgi:hypothetical protein
MITAEQIPHNAIDAAEAEILAGIARNFTSEEIARLAIAAAINAWTRAERRRWTVPSVTPSECDAIILPIMTPLGADFEKVWDDNAAELYEE